MKRLFGMCFLLVGCSSVPERMDNLDYEPVITVYQQPAKENGSIFSTGSISNPYGEPVASAVGDVITVMLDESMTATKRTSSNASKSTSVEVQPLNLLGVPVSLGSVGAVDTSIGLDSGSSFNGAGGASQSNAMAGVIAVTVHKVLPNGNLFVKGEKWIRINTGEELVKLSGVIRKNDVMAGNVVSSAKIADARIVYSGEGFIKNSAEPGFLYKVFNGEWWPF